MAEENGHRPEGGDDEFIECTGLTTSVNQIVAHFLDNDPESIWIGLAEEMTDIVVTWEHWEEFVDAISARRAKLLLKDTTEQATARAG